VGTDLESAAYPTKGQITDLESQPPPGFNGRRDHRRTDWLFRPPSFAILTGPPLLICPI